MLCRQLPSLLQRFPMGNGFKLEEGEFRLEIGNNFFTVKVVRHCQRLPRVLHPWRDSKSGWMGL